MKEKSFNTGAVNLNYAEGPENSDYFDETYAGYLTEKLFPQIQCPVLLLQANPELGGLMRDEDVQKAMGLLSKAYR